MEVEYRVIPLRRTGNMPGTSFLLNHHELESELTLWKREGFLFAGINNEYVVLEKITASDQA